jgi:hypothetical protein
MTDKAIADFWFDPSCPGTWTASRWIVEVTAVRPVEVRWNVMSLSVLNEGRDDDPEGDPDGYLWVPARICAVVQRDYGHGRAGELYAALWTHGRDGPSEWREALEDGLSAAGLPVDLVEAGLTDVHDDLVRVSHQAGMDAIGGEAGTPVVAVTPAADGERIAFNGPSLSRVPRGEEAGLLWDGALLVAGTPGFLSLSGRSG